MNTLAHTSSARPLNAQRPRNARRPRNPKPLARRAFTLLELLVALAIVTVLAGAMVASLRVAFKAKAACEAATDSTRSVDLAFELLRQDLMNAMPELTNTPTVTGPMEGTDNGSLDDLNFFTTASAPDGPDANMDVKQVEWLADMPTAGPTNGTVSSAPASTTGGRCLLRRVTRNVLASVTPTPVEQMICRNVSALNFRYYDGTDWNDSWDSDAQGQALPMAVEVTLQLQVPPADASSGAPPTTKTYVRVFQVACSSLQPSGVTGAGGGQ
jgi:prepilin-type N-terminal cleavage/methylation domain-containing protein